MKLDSNTAWKEAIGAVAANREVVMILTGVFLFLPSLAFALLFPQPQPEPGMSAEQMSGLFMQFYGAALPWLLIMAVFQAIGVMAILTLFTDRTRPTVGEALREGAIGMVSYLAAQFLLGVAFALVGTVLLAIGGVTGSTAVVAVALAIVAIALVYVALRAALVAPVIAVERIRNPITALRRSWNLTRGNAGSLFLFLFLMILAFGVIMLIVMGIIGVVLALVTGGELARIVAAVVSSALSAVFTLYFISALAAVHRQLSGPSNESLSDTFA